MEAGFTGTREVVAGALVTTLAADDDVVVEAMPGSQQMTRDDTTV